MQISIRRVVVILGYLIPCGELKYIGKLYILLKILKQYNYLDIVKRVAQKPRVTRGLIV